MAYAYECDRCGTLYKNNALIRNCVTEYKDLIETRYDFCPDCYKSFYEWLYKYKQQEPEDIEVF